MAYMNTLSKAEPIEPSADNGALDLSVSSPRRAPSASDRLSNDASPPRSLNSPPRGGSVPKPSSFPKTAPSAFDLPQSRTPQQHHESAFANLNRASASSATMSSPLSNQSHHHQQQPRQTPTQAIHSKSPSKSTVPVATSSSTSCVLDLEKLRSVHHVMQNRPNAASITSQNQQMRHSIERPKMPVPPQNRQVTASATVNSQMLKHGPIQTLKSPPPPGADGDNILSNVATASNQIIQPAVSRPPNAVQSTAESQTITTNSLIRIQPSGFLNWNGQPLQFVTNVRLPPGSKVPGMSNVQLAAAPHLLKIAPEMPMPTADHNNKGIVQQHNKIQPKQPPVHPKQPILPAPNGNSSNARPQFGVIDSATVTMAMQRFQTKAQKVEQDVPGTSSNKVAISGKIPSPPSQMRFPQAHRPIMPKPCRPAHPPTQAPQPVIYLCTLPTAPVTAQPPQQPVTSVSSEPNSNVTSSTSSALSAQHASGSSSSSVNNGTPIAPVSSAPVSIMDAVLKDEHKTPPPQQTAVPLEVPISIQIVTTTNPIVPPPVPESEKKNKTEDSKEVVSKKAEAPLIEEHSSSEAGKTEENAAKIAKTRRSSVDEPAHKKAKENRNASPASSSKPETTDTIKTSVKKPPLSNKAKMSAKKRQNFKKPNIITHVIDGFVILESDQPILTGALEPDVADECEVEDSDVSSEKPIITLKRKRRVSSTPSKTSSSATLRRPGSAASGAAPSPAGSNKCFKCKRQIPVSTKGVKNYNFKGSRLCGFKCYSQVRHEYSISSNKQKRKFNTENAAANSPVSSSSKQQTQKVSPQQQQEASNKKSVSPQQRSVSPIKVAAMPPFLMSPLPTAPLHYPHLQQQQQAVISPATSSVISSSSNKPPNQWTVSDVNDFIKNIPGCEEAAQKFLEQEIDGPALLLLKSEVMVQLMGLKIGPVLKITSRLSSITSGSSGTTASSTVGSSPPSASRLSHPLQTQAPSSAGTPLSSFVKQQPTAPSSTNLS